MDACDELHSASVQAAQPGIKMFKADVPGGYRFRLISQAPLRVGSDREDRDDRLGRGTVGKPGR